MPLTPSLTPPRIVPVLLAFVAGSVDAITLLALFGLFVAQVTGSFVTIGAQIVARDPASVMHVLAIPVFFIGGAAIVVLIAAQTHARRALAQALAFEGVLLAAFMTTGIAASPFTRPDSPAAVLAGVLGLLAMGVQSATVRLMLRHVPSTNVMTTNTSLLAIDVAEWLIASVWLIRASGNADARMLRAQAATRFAALAPIMVGFFAGSVYGAVGFTMLGFWPLLMVIAIIVGLIDWALWR